ncbi:hypothetical protein C0J52_02420 [Blattella germanica]|nr:hypothetical protein C0J52_02420 [Blattella germanica]
MLKIGIPFQHKADTENPEFGLRWQNPFRFPHGRQAAGVDLPTTDVNIMQVRIYRPKKELIKPNKNGMDTGLM